MSSGRGFLRWAWWLGPLVCGCSSASGSSSDAGLGLTCPAPVAVTGGAACHDPGMVCDAAYGHPTCRGPVLAFSCTCKGGAWQCPPRVDGGACPPPPSDCPLSGAVVPGATCTASPATSCPTDASTLACDGGAPVVQTCACVGGNWRCPPLTPPVCDVDAGYEGGTGADGGP